jgi:hypothetical protein
MPSITTEYEDKFSKDDLPIYFVRCLKPWIVRKNHVKTFSIYKNNDIM